MFDNIKRLKKMTAIVDEIDSSKKNEDNIITIKCGEETFSPFTDKDFLSEEAAEYLRHKSKSLSVKSDVRIKAEGDAARFKRALRAYFYNEFADNRREYRKNATISVIFTILSIIALSASFTLAYFGKEIFAEIINIAGWVFMWEVVENIFIIRYEIRVKQLRSLNLINAEVLDKNGNKAE